MTKSTIPSPRPRIRFRAISTSSGESSAPASDNAPDQARITADPSRHRRKREPNRGSFPAGVSGNPRGRPRSAKGAKVMVRKAFDRRIDMQTARGSRKVAIFEALLAKEISLAAEGDWRARRTVFELAKWALGEAPGLPLEPGSTEAGELTETGQAIIDWFADEIRARDRDEGEGE